MLALALAGPALPAGVKTIKVKAPSELRLAGTNIYCTVGTTGGATVVTCARFPHGPSRPPVGLGVFSSDAVVGVARAGTSKIVHSARNAPTVTRLVGPITGGRSYPSVVTLGLNEAALVSGSRMIVLVDPATGGGNAIGVLFLDSQARPVPGSYSVGISNHSVTLIGVTLSGAPRVVYSHAVG